MIAIAFLVWLLAPTAAYHTQPTGPNNRTAKEATKLTYQTNAESRGGVESAVVHQAFDAQPAKENGQGDSGDGATNTQDWADYVNAFSTLVIAMFTIGLFIGLLVQIGTSRAIERAWILAEVQWDKGRWPDGKAHVLHGRSSVMGAESTSTAVYVQLVCKNEGASPAWITEKRMGFAIGKDLPIRPALDMAEIIQSGREPLGIGNTDDPITKESTVSIGQGIADVGDVSVIYGVVKYEDIFGRQHTTMFGYRITPTNELKRLEGYAAYNYST